jgi:hypothetical protein
MILDFCFHRLTFGSMLEPLLFSLYNLPGLSCFWQGVVVLIIVSFFAGLVLCSLYGIFGALSLFFVIASSPMMIFNT